MMKKHKFSLLVFMKSKYKYSSAEEMLTGLAIKRKGKCVGGGTCLETGKRDLQFLFHTIVDARNFMKKASPYVHKYFDLQPLYANIDQVELAGV